LNLTPPRDRLQVLSVSTPKLAILRKDDGERVRLLNELTPPQPQTRGTHWLRAEGVAVIEEGPGGEVPSAANQQQERPGASRIHASS
jgi:hypothetical protein